MILPQLFYALGWMLVILAISHVPGLIAGLVFQEAVGTTAMVLSTALSAFAGIGLLLSFRGTNFVNDRRLTLLTPFAGFSVLAVFGAIPFAASGVTDGAVDAYFEALSGLTTTGSTMITSISDAPKSIVLWRATLNWLGGFGTIVIGVSILPIIGIGAMHLVQSKLPRGEGWHLFDRMRGAAGVLALTYSSLTLLCFIMLTLVGGMGGFEALCVAMSTLSTGGFGPVDGPIGATGRGAGYIQLILIVFMTVGALNITLFWRAMRGKGFAIYEYSESRYFLILLGIGCLLLILASLLGVRGDTDVGTWGALLNSMFAAVSAATTTGFAATGDVGLGLMAGITLAGLVFIGGTAGSTAGGLKFMRMLILIRHSNRELDRLAHPHSATRVRFAMQRVAESDLTAVWNMAFGLLLLSVLGTLVLAAYNVPFQSAIAGSIASISNAGPAAYLIAPEFPGYAGLSAVPKIVLAIMMLIGRLEVTMFLALLSFSFWRR